MRQPFKVVLVDDHVLIRTGISAIVQSFHNYEVLFEASSGKEMIDRIEPGNLPDLVLMDVNMPEMDGYSATGWLTRHFPGVKTLALSMFDTENSIIRMFKAGVKGYVMKYSEPAELRAAMDALVQKGCYYSELVTGRLVHTIKKYDDDESAGNPLSELNDREIEFLKFACTELTYKEIAKQMYLSPRTIDGYRDSLFEKLSTKSRVGLVTFAIRNGIAVT
ncbi:response regulator transcription factor [Flavihumibacter solisilvae]|uniref:Ligand-binding protein SH3 n=1 Tax=Flavihumibacter solisilvae TaxID=1349421 RepID=A0A0C1L595_9BACT|nr:response regulator transcription factor [Flavihumibacter solisilvae]KIC94721.1 ligand-binding protein SH3 [Flavihumibacter solisilvae]